MAPDAYRRILNSFYKTNRLALLHEFAPSGITIHGEKCLPMVFAD